MNYTKTLSKNIQYGTALNVHGEQEKLYCDIVQPDNSKKHALVIINHGGGFFQGDKAGGMHPMFDVFAAQLGLTVVYPNYRLADVLQFNGKSDAECTKLMHEAAFMAIEDNRAVVRYLLANNKKYNIDPNQIWIGGVSAGAVIGMQAIHWDESEYINEIDVAKWTNTSNEGVTVDFAGAISFSGAIFKESDIDPTTKPIIQWYGLKDTTLRPEGGVNHKCPYIGPAQVEADSEYYANPIYTMVDPTAGHCGNIPGNPLAKLLAINKAKSFFLNTLKTLIH